MSEVVLDASVVLKWFHAEGERHLEAARELRKRFEAGELRVLAPPLLWLELLNVAARRWLWTREQLEQLAAALLELGFELLEPDLVAIARCAARGLTAYDAAYVAVAELAGVDLITDDAEVARAAPELATALADLATRDSETAPEQFSSREQSATRGEQHVARRRSEAPR